VCAHCVHNRVLHSESCFHRGNSSADTSTPPSRSSPTAGKNSAQVSMLQWTSIAYQVRTLTHLYKAIVVSYSSSTTFISDGVYNQSDATLYCMVLKRPTIYSSEMENSTDAEMRCVRSLLHAAYNDGAAVEKWCDSSNYNFVHTGSSSNL
jgi:hypothetical protein